MGAQILKLTLLPGVGATELEQTLHDKVLPGLQILRRTVQSTSCRLFRTGSDTTGPISYILLVFTQMVGATPETAGAGPSVLCEFPLPVNALMEELVGQATAEVLNEV